MEIKPIDKNKYKDNYVISECPNCHELNVQRKTDSGLPRVVCMHCCSTYKLKFQ